MFKELLRDMESCGRTLSILRLLSNLSMERIWVVIPGLEEDGNLNVVVNLCHAN